MSFALVLFGYRLGIFPSHFGNSTMALVTAGIPTGKQACVRRWVEYGCKLCSRSVWASVRPVFSYLVDFHVVPVTWRSEPSLKLCFKHSCKRKNSGDS